MTPRAVFNYRRSRVFITKIYFRALFTSPNEGKDDDGDGDGDDNDNDDDDDGGGGGE